MGQTPTPDASWTDFIPLSASGAAIGGSSRYLQYRVNMTTSSGNQTPVLETFNVQYSLSGDAVPPVVITRSPAPGAVGINPAAPITVTLSELLDPATVSTATVRLRISGSSTDVPVVVTLTGSTIVLDPSSPLAGNTLYEVTVTTGVKDVAGNALAGNSQWTFTTASAQWAQTTVADFATGTHQTTAAVNTGGGTLQLATSFVDEFSGTTLGSQWTVNSWASMGGGPASTDVSNGTLKMAGEQLLSTSSFPGQSIIARVRFGSTPFQHVGLATDFGAFAGNYWAAFSNGGTTNTLYARVNTSGAEQVIDLGPLAPGFHDYRIVPTGSTFEFYVDGVLKTTVTASFPAGTPLRAAMSSFLGGALELDSVQIESFAATGEYTSSVFDATGVVTWGAANWNASVPAGTTLIVETRSGNTPSPDGTWSGWAAASNGSTVASPASRYLQYRVRFTTSAPSSTPQLFDIALGWL
jgi:hypothetical protein